LTITVERKHIYLAISAVLIVLVVSGFIFKKYFSVALKSNAKERCYCYEPVEQVTPRIYFRMSDTLENWEVGSLHNIIWTKTCNVQSISICYRIKGQSRETFIDTGFTCIQEKVWHIPNELANKSIELIIRGRISNEIITSDTRTINIGASKETNYKFACLLNNAPFWNRDGAGLVSFKDDIYMIGGWTDDRANKVETFSEVW
jgi:hypothetical protein